MTLCASESLVNRTPEGGRAVSLFCRSWNCETCAPRRKKQLQAIAAHGAPTKFLTLTIRPVIGRTPNEELTLLHSAWRIIAKRWARRVKKKSVPYIAFVEATKAGHPHLHILLRAPYLDTNKISQWMDELANSPIVKISEVKSKGHAASYVAKYAGKAPGKFGTHKRYWASRDYDLGKDETKKKGSGAGQHWERVSLSLIAFGDELVSQGQWGVEIRGDVLTWGVPP